MRAPAKKGAKPALLIFDLDVSPDHLAAAVTKVIRERIVPRPRSLDEVYEARDKDGVTGTVPGPAAPLTARRAAVKDARRRPVPAPSGFRADLPPSSRQSREELQEVHDLTQSVAAAEEGEARDEGFSGAQRRLNAIKSDRARARAEKARALKREGKSPRQIARRLRVSVSTVKRDLARE